MPALTWRDVAVPNFSPAIEGVSQANQAFQNAAGKLMAGIKNYDEGLDEQATKAAWTKALGIKDVNAFDAALAADPTMGGGSRVDVNTMRQLFAQGNNLRDRRNADFTYDKGVEDRTRELATSDYFTAAAPLISIMRNPLASNEDRQAAQKKLEGLNTAHVNGSAVYGTAGEYGNGIKGKQEFDASAQRMKIEKTDADRRSEEYNNNKYIASLAGTPEAMSAAEGGPATIYAYLQSKKVPPHLMAQAIQSLSALAPTAQGIAQSNAEFAGTTDVDVTTSLGNTVIGRDGKPVQMRTPDQGLVFNESLANHKFVPGMTYAQMDAQHPGLYKESKQYYEKRGIKHDGSTAFGIFQMVGKTRQGLYKEAGVDPNAPITVETEERLAKALFDRVMRQNAGKSEVEKARALAEQWDIFKRRDGGNLYKNGAITAVRNGWSSARGIIAAGESSTNLGAKLVSRADFEARTKEAGATLQSGLRGLRDFGDIRASMGKSDTQDAGMEVLKKAGYDATDPEFGANGRQALAYARDIMRVKLNGGAPVSHEAAAKMLAFIESYNPGWLAGHFRDSTVTKGEIETAISKLGGQATGILNTASASALALSEKHAGALTGYQKAYSDYQAHKGSDPKLMSVYKDRLDKAERWLDTVNSEISQRDRTLAGASKILNGITGSASVDPKRRRFDTRYTFGIAG